VPAFGGDADWEGVKDRNKVTTSRTADKEGVFMISDYVKLNA